MREDEFELNQNMEETEETVSSHKKDKKPGVGTGIAIGCGGSIFLLAVVILVGVVIVQKFMPSWFRVQNTYVNAADIPDNRGLNLERVNAKLQTLQTLIENRFLFETDTKKIEDGIYSGMIAGLDDPYSQYYNEESYKEMTEDNAGVYTGVGALLQEDRVNNTITVIRVFEGSPAEEAGMKAGDVIYKVEDIYAAEMDMDQLVSSHIRGAEGTVVHITVIRDGEEVLLTITRRSIDTPTVENKMLENNIGYISVSQFAMNTSEQFINALEKLKADGAKSLIIDLRDNPGGVLDAAVAMADYILPDGGLITYTADKTGIGAKYYAQDEHEEDLPIVLLVNENSASASEVFTGALKDYGRVTIIGKQTFGKGIVQSFIPLGDDTAVKLTVEHYYTPEGFDLHGEGIAPNKEVELNEKCEAYGDENDNQLAEAVKILK